MKRQTVQNMLATNTSSKASASTWTKFSHPNDGGIKFLHNMQQTLYKAEDHHLSNMHHENKETHKKGLRTTPNANWILPHVLWSSLIPLLIMTYIIWVSTHELYHHVIVKLSEKLQYPNIQTLTSNCQSFISTKFDLRMFTCTLFDCCSVYHPNATDHLCSPCITGWPQRCLFNYPVKAQHVLPGLTFKNYAVYLSVFMSADSQSKQHLFP